MLETYHAIPSVLGSVDREDVRLHQPCCHNASTYGLQWYVDNTLPSRIYASPRWSNLATRGRRVHLHTLVDC